MNNPITKILENITLSSKERSIRAEKDRLAQEKARVAAREKELDAMTQELRDLHTRRDGILQGKANLITVRSIAEFKLQNIRKKITIHLTSSRINGNTVPASFISRAVGMRAQERELESFLSADAPMVEKSLTDALKQVDSEIAAFEDRGLSS